MKSFELSIRDPYVMVHNDMYYMYGTRASQTWGYMDGFDCYTSSNLEDWDGPYEIFRKTENFFADRCYWAPECYEWNGTFYLFTTLASETIKQGVYVLKSDNPLGPFEMMHRITPENQACIDGTVCEVQGKKYLVYSHTLIDEPRGSMEAMELDPVSLKAVSDSIHLFYASDVSCAKPVPFAKEEFNIDGDAYFTDGPCVLVNDDESLMMLWSSWNTGGYGVGIAYSPSGSMAGPWTHDDDLLISDGGHGMVFTSIDEGIRFFTLHRPNDFTKERPTFLELEKLIPKR